MMLSNTMERPLATRLLAYGLGWSLLVIGCSDSGEISPQDRTVLPPSAAPGAAGGAAPVGPAISCAQGQTACGAACVNTSVDPRNCGACGKSCGAGTCSSGQCSCPSTLTSCPAGCIDTLTDSQNCGVCGRTCGASEKCQEGQCLSLTAVCTPACANGQVCSNGMCKCPETTQFCGGACVDVNTTPKHCGKCDAACAQGAVCQAGVCACQPGQTMCGTDCVDLQISPQNCGMCGKACATNETCMAGQCRAPAGTDGCSGAATGITISEVDAYQSIKIPLSKGVTPIDAAMRQGIVQGRPTLMRVAVTPGSGFTPRMMSARVTIMNGAGEDQYYSKQMVSKASTDADTASAFQIPIPGEKITEGTSYSVELVECGGAAMGTSMNVRLPAMGETPFMAKSNGTLRVTIIPLPTNNHMPDTSDKTLQVYKDYLLAMYPVSKVELTVGKPLSISYPVNWNTALEQIRTQRNADKPASDVYYYGFLTPTNTLKDYCGRGCTAGVGYVGQAGQAQTRVAMGLAFGDEISASTMAHEVGHNHGRQHAPCAPGNQIQGVDPSYPHSGAKTGVWGYDSRMKKFYDPDKTTDIMGYCDPKWVSDYTYKGFYDRSGMINKPLLAITNAAAIQRYRAIIVEADGARWSQPFAEAGEPFGEPETADVLDIDGNTVGTTTVYRTQIGDNAGASTVLVPEPEDGWSSIKLNDALALPFSAPITVPDPQ